MAKKKPKKPAKQGVSPISGCAPPEEYRWKPGQSGNPEGRKSAGATSKEWANILDARNLTDDQLRAIVRDRRQPNNKKVAAEKLLHRLKPVMADYEPLIDGTGNLADAEKAGVDTSLIKKIKSRQEIGPYGNVVAVTRELELLQVAGEEFDRIADRTEGKPTQALQLTGGDLPVAVRIITPLTRGKHGNDET